jgi:hypothetical protein
MMSDNCTLQVSETEYLNVAKYLIVACNKLIQDIAVAVNEEDPRQWIRLAKLVFPYAVTEICQKDQNNQLIGKH